MPHPGQMHLVVPVCHIVRDGRVLILKRSEQEVAFPGKWTIPGGKLDRADYEPEPKDTDHGWYHPVEDTLRREITEEAGVEVGQLHFLEDFSFIRPDDQAVVVLKFWAPWVSGEVHISEDFTDSAWVTAAEAKSYELIDDLLDEMKRLPAAAWVSSRGRSSDREIPTAQGMRSSRRFAPQDDPAGSDFSLGSK